MQDDIQYPQYAISLAHGGIVKFFSSAESSESCAVTPDRNAAAHFGTKEAAAATIRWCVPLRTAEAEIVEIDSVKENREDFRRVLTENSVRVNARAFRDELSKKIESSKREGITVVLTRHGKDQAAVVNSDDLWKLNLLEHVLTEQKHAGLSLETCKNLHEAIYIIKECADTYLERMRHTYISDLEDYCVSLIVEKLRRRKLQDNLDIQEITFAAWYIVRQEESRRRYSLNREILNTLILDQMPVSKLLSIIRPHSRLLEST